MKLFEDQGNSDAILDDLACMLGCTRSSLHGGHGLGSGRSRYVLGRAAALWPLCPLPPPMCVACEEGAVLGRLAFQEK